jgi:hypothetical protein
MLELDSPEPETLTPTDARDDMLAGAQLAQAELVMLELWRIRREMLSDPGAVKVNVGKGYPAEQSVTGNRQDPFNGVVIYNPTPATLAVGFEVGMGILAPATVPPFSWASFPERYTNLSIALPNMLDLSQTIATPVTILRTRIPPVAGAGSYGASVPQQGLVSIAGAAPAVNAVNGILDNGFPRSNHSLYVVGSGVTGGVVSLEGSPDGQSWVSLAATGALGAAPAVVAAANTPTRYLAAIVTTAITGGTVTATLASSG